MDWENGARRQAERLEAILAVRPSETRKAVAARFDYRPNPRLGKLGSEEAVAEWAALFDGRDPSTPRPWAEAGEAVVAEREAERVPVFGDPDYIDALTPLEPDAMAALTPELRWRAGALFVAAIEEARGRSRRPWAPDEQWAREREEWLRGEMPLRPPEPKVGAGGRGPMRGPRSRR